MRPRPSIPSCSGESVTIASLRVRASRVTRVYETPPQGSAHGMIETMDSPGLGCARGTTSPPSVSGISASSSPRIRVASARLSLEAAGIHADLSKHRVTEETIQLLIALAAERDVAGRRDALFRGERVNTTEDRAALHVALRMPRERSLVVDGQDVVRDVHDVLDRMAALARAGSLR